MTDNVATSYFQNQKKLTPKQARWQDFLAEFDYVMEYKPGIANVVADALSRKTMLASASSVASNLLDQGGHQTRPFRQGTRGDGQRGEDPTVLGRRCRSVHRGTKSLRA